MSPVGECIEVEDYEQLRYDGEQTMSMKEIVAALMESPYYFSLSLKMRLREVKLVQELINSR